MIRERIVQSPRIESALLGLLVALIGLIKYGIDMWSGWPNMYAISLNLEDPHVSPLLEGNQDYVLSSSTSALIVGLLPGESQFTFIAFSVILAIAALWLPFLSSRISSSRDRSRLLFIFMAGGALLPVLLTWIGSYDPTTIIALTLALGFRNKFVNYSGWALATFNHSSIAIFALVAVAVIHITIKESANLRYWLTSSVIPLAGVVSGMALNTALMSQWGGVTSRWDLFRMYDLTYYFNNTVAAMPVLLFTSLGVGWLVILRPSWAKLPETKALIALGLFLPLALSLTTIDQTRVIAVCLFAPIFCYVAYSQRVLDRIRSDATWRNYAVASVIIPVPLFLIGSIDQTSWQTILYWTSNF